MSKLDLRPEKDDLEGKETEDESIDESSEEEDTSEDSSTSQKSDDDTVSDEDETSQKTDDLSSEEEEEESEDEAGEDTDDDIDDSEFERAKAGKKAELDRLDSQIVEMRRKRREMRKEEDGEGKDVFTKKEDNIDLEDVAKEDIELIEKVIKSKGYIRKDEQYKNDLNYYKDEWLKIHPEYLPENDPDDINWNALNREFNNYYKAPANPRDITKILDKIHKDLNPTSTQQASRKSRAKTEAAKQKIKSTSKSSGGSGAKPKLSKPKLEGVNRSMMQGFTEKELDELGL